MPLLYVTYRIRGYQLADALRPDPFWGKKIFTVDTAKLPTEDMQQTRQAAQDTAPDGDDFFRIELADCSAAPVNGAAVKDDVRSGLRLPPRAHLRTGAKAHEGDHDSIDTRQGGLAR